MKHSEMQLAVYELVVSLCDSRMKVSIHDMLEDINDIVYKIEEVAVKVEDGGYIGEVIK